jgi:glutamine synthetase
VNVEGRLTALMARTMILPACIRYQGEVAQAVVNTKAAGVDASAQLDLLKTLTSTMAEFQKATAHLDHELAHQGGDVYEHAKHCRDNIVTGMAAVRTLGDKLETLVADDYWPLPTYREMLFLK